MMRTKWMRLGVRDPADILRWAAGQNTRLLDDFRYRVIRGREFVSFRMVARYAIEIGTREIIVVAHVKPNMRQRLRALAMTAWRAVHRRASALAAGLGPQVVHMPEARGAELYEFAPARVGLPSRR
ncbi:MAG TPA: hypothetical protein VM782_11760 [Stellaceae bacterium]|nr:hypothetical protein [Stellaceae bacterium]